MTGLCRSEPVLEKFQVAADRRRRLRFKSACGSHPTGTRIDEAVDGAELLAGIADPALKARVKDVGEEAVSHGVFGVPWVVVDSEPFWGWDQLPMVERRLAGG